MTTRTFDREEIANLLTPFCHYEPRLTLTTPDNRLAVHMVLRGDGGTRAEIRTAATEAGNQAIAAVEAAGYEHAAAPTIRLGGIEVQSLDKEACDYLIDAELTMELIGKRS